MIIFSEGMPGYIWDFYATSLKMSSYLVAFLVSEFVDLPANPIHRVPFRLWVRPEYVNRARYHIHIEDIVNASCGI